jgi:hypothetical protein
LLLEKEKHEDKLIESVGKSTKIDESITATPGKEQLLIATSGESSLTKKRLFSEIE